MRTKHSSLSSGTALSGVLESGGKAYLSPQAKPVSLISEGIVCTSDGETEGTNPDGPGF